MIKNVLYFITAFTFLILPAPASCKIVHTDSFGSILPEIERDILIFLDLDDTLIVRKTMLGSTPWWKYCLSKVYESSSSKQTIQEKLMPLFFQASLEMPVLPVEDKTAEIIADLQKNGVRIYGITTRPRSFSWEKAFDLLTIHELQQIGIEFRSEEPLSLPYFNGGIIFTGHGKKELFLVEFLSHLGTTPSKIVFVDDDAEQVSAVESALQKSGIPSVCFRYEKMDAQHAAFDPLISNIQLQSFHQHHIILDDDEARHIAEHMQGINPDFYLLELLR